MFRLIVVWVGCLCAAGASAAEAPSAADAPNALLVEGLLHSAMNLYHTPSAVARAGRLVAISEYLASIAPNDPRARRLLADVYQSRGELAQAAAAAKSLLNAAPGDFAAGRRWLRFQLETLNRAGERIEFLTSILKDGAYPKPLQSVAAVELARIHAGQGARADAVAALDQALRLDPLNQAALLSRLEFRETPSAVDRAETMLTLLKGNPRAHWVARELASLLCDLGLFEEGLAYYRHAWALWQGNRPVSNAPASFAAEYLSALLDAGKADAAVALFAPAVERLKTSTEFSSLMIEAYTRAGQNVKADPLRKAVEEQYRKKLLSSRVAEGLENPGITPKAPDAQAAKMTAEVAVDLAWFYLLVEKRPAEARKSISEAVELGAKGDAVELCIGAALLASGEPKGLERLEPLAEDYPLAAAYVARYELAAGRTEKGTKILLAGLAKGRRNLACRMLVALAGKYNIEVPPMKDAQAVAAKVKEFDPRVLEMGLQPEKFIRITTTPPGEATAMCEPIHVTATLENIGPIPVSVDEWGLLDRQLGLEIDFAGGKMSFSSMPMLTWPAPRYLAPNRKVTASCRLDVGPIERFLANRPLAPVELRVEPVVSPRELIDENRKDTRVVSGLEPMKLPGLAIRRRGLIASESSAEQYNQALSAMRSALAEGDLPARVMAARRVAALLAWIREVTEGRASVAEAIRPVMNEKYLLALMGMALRDKSDVVRSEMITALQYADMGSAMLNEVGLVVEDPSPLVRFRVAELIGASGTKGNETLINLYAKDADPRVRTMARAFLHAWRKAKGEEGSQESGVRRQESEGKNK
ncbi:MAG: hypothetical protein JW849_07920 [Phycisphaerae bacterium]|nr:hypothetical protein [Phycisphaerae bacterium]